MIAVSRRWLRLIAPALALLLVAAKPAPAQIPPWPQRDGFDFFGQCCAPAMPSLPQFPPITQRIKFICWRDCAPTVCQDICVDIGQPVPANIGPVMLGCGVYFVPVTIRTCQAVPQTLWSGRLVGTYARTWLEDTVPDPLGLKEVQVWRLLLNGDLVPSTFLIQNFGNNPCVVPPCRANFGNRVYWFGYIDYRNDCANNLWEAEWAIDHECDFFAHNADSRRPAPAGGAFHPRHSYNFVGPSTFVCSLNIPVSNGPVIQESVRTIRWNGPNQPPVCFVEEPMNQGILQPGQDICMCVPPIAGPQYNLSQFQGVGVCGTNFITAGQPKPFVQKRLGFFQGAGPAMQKFLLLKMGDLNWQDACTQLATVEYFEGVETIGGFPACDLQGVQLGRQFDDDGSSNHINNARRKGIPHVVSKIINANLP